MGRGAPEIQCVFNVLGRCAFGEVYSGQGCNSLPIAVKVFPIDSQDEAESEVRRHAALPSHPHIIKLLDVDVMLRAEKPASFALIYEQYDTDLRQCLLKGPLHTAAQRHVLRSVLAALAFMHEAGLVHADLKPANVLVRGAGRFKGT